MNDGRSRQLTVVAGESPGPPRCRSGCGKLINGDFCTQGFVRLGQGDALDGEGYRLASVHLHHMVAVDPLELILVIGDGVLAHGAVDRVEVRRGAVLPHVAHHVPGVVIGLPVVAGGVRQAEAVPHLVCDDARYWHSPRAVPRSCASSVTPVQAQVPARRPRRSRPGRR